MEKLIKIQYELKVPKGNFNAFGKYKYRSAEDILEAVKPLLNKYECSLVLTDDVVLIGSKWFLCATAKLCYLDKCETSKGFAEISEHKGMSSEQCTGTASSYARKYALNGLFLIDETESDADQITAAPTPPKAKETISDERFAAMLSKLNEGAVTFEIVKNKFVFNAAQIAILKDSGYVA